MIETIETLTEQLAALKAHPFGAALAPQIKHVEKKIEALSERGPSSRIHHSAIVVGARDATGIRNGKSKADRKADSKARRAKRGKVASPRTRARSGK